MSKLRTLTLLFFDFFKIASFVIGGGYAIIAVADEHFSRKRKWIREGELIESLPLFQMIPGIMAGHAAIFVGRRVAGFFGSIVSLFAISLPSILIFSLVANGYQFIPLENPFLNAAFAGARASVTGIIFAMIWRSWKKSIANFRAAIIFALSFFAIFFGCPVLLVAMLTIIFAIGDVLWTRWRRAKNSRRTTYCSFSLAPLLFLQYGFLAFGGGYVLVPFYLHDFVGPTAPYLQLASEEFANLMALTQMTPGPIGINGATFFGFRLFGLAGAFATSFCLLIPGFIILSLALVSLERFRENDFVKSILANFRPVTIALMCLAILSFAKMSLWTFQSWENFAIHPLAIFLASATAFAHLRFRVSFVRLIFAAVFLATLAKFFAL